MAGNIGIDTKVIKHFYKYHIGNEENSPYFFISSYLSPDVGNQWQGVISLMLPTIKNKGEYPINPGRRILSPYFGSVNEVFNLMLCPEWGEDTEDIERYGTFMTRRILIKGTYEEVKMQEQNIIKETSDILSKVFYFNAKMQEKAKLLTEKNKNEVLDIYITDRLVIKARYSYSFDPFTDSPKANVMLYFPVDKNGFNIELLKNKGYYSDELKIGKKYVTCNIDFNTGKVENEILSVSTVLTFDIKGVETLNVAKGLTSFTWIDKAMPNLIKVEFAYSFRHFYGRLAKWATEEQTL